MPGHLFVVRSDLTQLACDAWLVPTDAWLTIEAPWTDVLPDRTAPGQGLREAAPAGFGRDTHTFPLDVSPGQPIPLITDVGGVDLEQLPARVLEFLDIAYASCKASNIRGREIPLFAFPLVGTRRGGWDRAQGDLTRTVVAATSRWVATHDADAVLVSWTPQAFAAAQSERRRLTAERMLEPSLAERASWLGTQASLGRLVLFLGAGLGVPAGLPRGSSYCDSLQPTRGSRLPRWSR